MAIRPTAINSSTESAACGWWMRIFKTVKSHLVEIVLPASYPRLPPQCRMLTPIFHPNIAPHAICVGDHWSAGEPLVAARGANWRDDCLSELQHQKSPERRGGALGDGPTRIRCPSIRASLLVAAEDNLPGPPAFSPRTVARRPAPTGPADSLEETINLLCPGCRRRLRVPARAAGKRSRCPSCQTLFQVPEAT